MSSSVKSSFFSYGSSSSSSSIWPVSSYKIVTTATTTNEMDTTDDVMKKSKNNAIDVVVNDRCEIQNAKDHLHALERRQYLKQKRMTILRGLSGSGKSTLAPTLQRPGLSLEICSADHFFIDPDTKKYKFDGCRIGEAHASCLKRVLNAIKNQVMDIVIDNTHSNMWEYQNYKTIGAMHNYDVIVVQVGSVGEDEVNRFHARCQHAVPLSAIQSMQRRWQHDPDCLHMSSTHHIGRRWVKAAAATAAPVIVDGK